MRFERRTVIGWIAALAITAAAAALFAFAPISLVWPAPAHAFITGEPDFGGRGAYTDQRSGSDGHGGGIGSGIAPWNGNTKKGTSAGKCTGSGCDYGGNMLDIYQGGNGGGHGGAGRAGSQPTSNPGGTDRGKFN